ncbi:hypothetical protein CLOP_g13174 [Closterium sp. NIES-67]|nr:hypothetical protein CLOP_g231 [Closterium sp. NIES-67]GJP69657.1 hypothetical protein CLOP_g644 [Closterium sp. NIES-67]GJP82956.1 hypothetical protein CLOP_g13174 [Closterium sp. NIES-67]
MAAWLLAAASRAAGSACTRRCGSMALLPALAAQGGPHRSPLERFSSSHVFEIPRREGGANPCRHYSRSHSAAAEYGHGTRPTIVSTSSDGLRVATEAYADPTAPNTAAVGVWVHTGSRFESGAPHGTAYFLANMVFEALQRRLAEQLGIGGGKHVNAYCTREVTACIATAYVGHPRRFGHSRRRSARGGAI